MEGFFGGFFAFLVFFVCLFFCISKEWLVREITQHIIFLLIEKNPLMFIGALTAFNIFYIHSIYYFFVSKLKFSVDNKVLNVIGNYNQQIK